MASLRAVAYPLVQEARRWPPPSLRLVWPGRLSVVVTWRRDPTSVCWPSFPPTGPSVGVPFPPRGLVGSIPPLPRYYETLRFLAARPATLRCLRGAVPSEHLGFAPSDGRCSIHGLGFCQPVTRRPAVSKMETTRPPGFPGNPPARMPRCFDPGEVAASTAFGKQQCCLPPNARRRPSHLCISGLHHAAYELPVNASRPGSPQAHASLGSGWRPTLAGWD